VDVDASREVFFRGRSGRFCGLPGERAGYEDDAELGGGWHGVREKIVADFWNGAGIGHRRGRINAEGAESAEDAEKEGRRRSFLSFGS